MRYKTWLGFWLFLSLAGNVQAEVETVVSGYQYGLTYLPLMVMQEQHLVEKHAQILHIKDSAFTINQNVDLYIQGGAGLANTALIETTAFENAVKKHIYCDGIDGFTMRRCQLYNNNTYIAQNGVQFDGTTYTIRQVVIENTFVRATSSNNAYTAFSITGSLADLNSCRVRGTTWSDFDYTGQTRFSGWQFDQIAQNCNLVALSTTSVVLRPDMADVSRGNKSPLRLRGGAGGTPSTTGEWVQTEVASGGISISNASLANSTRYYTYLYDNNGVPTLEFSTTVYVTDSTSGYPVKTGDATRLYVGSVITDGAAAFLTANTGWLNPTQIAGSQVGTFAWMWYSGTSAALRRTTVVLPTSDTDGALV